MIRLRRVIFSNAMSSVPVGFRFRVTGALTDLPSGLDMRRAELIYRYMTTKYVFQNLGVM